MFIFGLIVCMSLLTAMYRTFPEEHIAEVAGIAAALGHAGAVVGAFLIGTFQGTPGRALFVGAVCALISKPAEQLVVSISFRHHRNDDYRSHDDARPRIPAAECTRP